MSFFTTPVFGIDSAAMNQLGNPFDRLVDAAGDMFSGAVDDLGQRVFESVVAMIFNWIGDAVTSLNRLLSAAINDTTAVDFGGWFANSELQLMIAALSAALLLVFLSITVLQGVMRGDSRAIAMVALRDLPITIAGTTLLVAVTRSLTGLVDVLSNVAIARTGGNLGDFVRALDPNEEGVMLMVFLVLLYLAAALMLWVEMLIRAALIYLVILFAPLAIATRVYPATRSISRRFIEIAISLILSKFAIAVAIGIGSEAVAGAAEEGVTANFTQMMTGTTMMILAAFMPFALFKLLPGLDGASVGQGIGSAPLRGAVAAASVGFVGMKVMGATGAVGKVLKGSGSKSPAPSPSPSSGSPTTSPGPSPGSSPSPNGGGGGSGSGGRPTGGGGPLPPSSPPSASSGGSTSGSSPPSGTATSGSSGGGSSGAAGGLGASAGSGSRSSQASPTPGPTRASPNGSTPTPSTPSGSTP